MWIAAHGRLTGDTPSATLEGAIANCLSVVTNLDGTLSIIVDTNCVTAETVERVLETMDAALFNLKAAVRVSSTRTQDSLPEPFPWIDRRLKRQQA